MIKHRYIRGDIVYILNWTFLLVDHFNGFDGRAKRSSRDVYSLKTRPSHFGCRGCSDAGVGVLQLRILHITENILIHLTIYLYIKQPENSTPRRIQM